MGAVQVLTPCTAPDMKDDQTMNASMTFYHDNNVFDRLASHIVVMIWDPNGE